MKKTKINPEFLRNAVKGDEIKEGKRDSSSTSQHQRVITSAIPPYSVIPTVATITNPTRKLSYSDNMNRLDNNNLSEPED